ncbi:Efflux RND transporter permease subunit [Rhodovastum atsumiense]|uniref:Efflux RND transporter permease subunit n=1 Tax=Rhodovastum atsumiense TaxID=504468 RepID=A0A5M6IRR7_9PROT|nr:efflux RND transporter permease subunit [Rhodovastum atsumiense]KAA5610609.1 efflux RND transporter permease subunit [Rhodovastum atsumiense]CAH2600728.1 Efflux RND transporter permease subunit [Rhodovastum atsumiense]
MQQGEPRNISAWAIRNPVATIVLFLLLTFGGLVAFPSLRINTTPDIELPAVVVTVMQPGAAPADLETEVTRRVEDAIAGLGDVKHITSTVVDGASTTAVEFALGKDPDRATNDVRDKVAQIRADLPAGIRDPIITRVEATGGAILTYTVAAPFMNQEQLSWFVDDTVAKALLAIPGVAQVNRVGGVDREIRVALRPDRLLALGITAVQVNQQLRDWNLNLPGGRGTLGASEQTIRTLGSAVSVQALRERPIILPGGRTARLADLADVTDATAEVRSAARLDGRPVVGFEVLRTRGSSEVTVAAEVAQRTAAVQAAHPGVELRRVASTVTFVEAGFHAAIEALVVGSTLAVLVVWLFLRDTRATGIVCLAMPLSLIPTFLLMKWLGFSLNNVTLLGLTLVVGVLVDDAIVEIENIVRHLRTRPGRGAWQAAMDASAEIGLAVVATTGAILAVFVPVAFMPGIPGQFFRQFGLTVAAAVAFSLVVARLLTPLMSAYLLKPAEGRPTGEVGDGAIGRRYLGLLRWCLRHRWAAIAGALGFFGLSIALVPLIPSDFMPAADRGRSALSIELAPGATLTDTEVVVQRATAILKARPEVASVFASLGTASTGGGAPMLGNVTRSGDPRTANLTVTLVPRDQRRLSQQRVEALVRPELEAIPGARVRFGADGQSGAKVSITLIGDDQGKLADAARELERQMRGIPALAGARSTASLARPELQILPREARAAELGISAAAIGATARIATIGDIDQNLARFNLPDRQIPIRVMLAEAARGDLDTLRALRVAGRNDLAVPLDAVAEIRYGAGPAQIDRLDRVRKATIEAELNGMPLGTATKLVAALPIMHVLPDGIRERETGDKEVMRELFGGFAVALGTGVLLVYLVLVLLFGGFVQPLTIMSALPLSLGGALMALLLAQKALGVSAVIGVLMLMGIVAKNSILLVEYAIVARRTGLERTAALVEAARKRARPIVMTTIAMTAGMAHIAAGIGADSEFRSPMALVVIGGLITSTLLSLVVVPVVFTLLDDLSRLAGRVVRRRRAVEVVGS